ncbi:hypothetical protein [Tumidithrix helvetica]|uniref:hypothetical protein n=1 Tax=Tumidithrix helvetica TaxID=3457545 RepID=UPI003CC54841
MLRTPLTSQDIDEIQPFTAVSSTLRGQTEYTHSTFAAALDALPTGRERIQIIMWLGTFDAPSTAEILLRGLSETSSILSFWG